MYRKLKERERKAKGDVRREVMTGVTEIDTETNIEGLVYCAL